MPYPPLQSVISLGKHLLHPLQYPGQRLSVFRLDIKDKPIVVKAETPNLEGKAAHGFLEHSGKKGGGFGPTEYRFAVVDSGTYLIPNILSKFT
jgi:hypothetical protein